MRAKIGIALVAGFLIAAKLLLIVVVGCVRAVLHIFRSSN